MLKAAEKLDTIRFATLYNTFGSEYGCFEKLAKNPKTKVVELHLINEVCMRNRRCEKHEFGSGMNVSDFEGKLKRKEKGLLSKLKVYFAKASRDLMPRMKPTSEFTCLVSPGLESNLSSEAGKVLIETARPYFPGCHMVWNPLRGKPISGALFEQHGEDPKLSPLCVYNNDGTILSPSEFPKQREKYAGCSLTAFWQLCDNGNKGVHSFVPPTKRTNFCGSADFQAAVSALTSKFEPPPANSFDPRDTSRCKTREKPGDGAKTGFLFKTSDTKQCRNGKCAVALFPAKFSSKFKRVELRKNGKVVDTFKFHYFSNEHGNRQTWSGTKTPADLPFNSVLEADGRCWLLNNPRQRID